MLKPLLVLAIWSLSHCYLWVCSTTHSRRLRTAGFLVPQTLRLALLSTNQFVPGSVKPIICPWADRFHTHSSFNRSGLERFPECEDPTSCFDHVIFYQSDTGKLAIEPSSKYCAVNLFRPVRRNNDHGSDPRATWVQISRGLSRGFERFC